MAASWGPPPAAPDTRAVISGPVVSVVVCGLGHAHRRRGHTEHSHGGDVHALAHQQVAGGPDGVFDGGEGEPELAILGLGEALLAHPIQHQLGCETTPYRTSTGINQGAGCRPLICSTAALPEQVPHRLLGATARAGARRVGGHAPGVHNSSDGENVVSDHPRQVPESVGEGRMVHVVPHILGLAECQPGHGTHCFPLLHQREKRAVVG